MRIFAVDSDLDSLALLRAQITSLLPSAHLCEFTSSADAIAAMNESCCDVAFLETAIGSDDGIILAKQLISINPNVNIVFLTDSDSHRAEAFAIHASGYVKKPINADKLTRETSDLRRPVPPSDKRLVVHTFGNFEVSCDGSPLAFKYKKTKQLLAYLIDRKGALCSKGELTAVLFEDDGEHKAYYHRLRRDLIHTLVLCGCGSVISQQRGMLGVSVDAVKCDLYDYLEGKIELTKLYHGEYMAQYSFAEVTNADLFARASVGR